LWDKYSSPESLCSSSQSTEKNRYPQRQDSGAPFTQLLYCSLILVDPLKMAWPKEKVYMWYICMIAATTMILYGYDSSTFNAVQGSDNWVEYFHNPGPNVIGSVNTAYTVCGVVAGKIIIPVSERSLKEQASSSLPLFPTALDEGSPSWSAAALSLLQHSFPPSPQEPWVVLSLAVPLLVLARVLRCQLDQLTSVRLLIVRAAERS
jgi:hypothetical protein